MSLQSKETVDRAKDYSRCNAIKALTSVLENAHIWSTQQKFPVYQKFSHYQRVYVAKYHGRKMFGEMLPLPYSPPGLFGIKM